MQTRSAAHAVRSAVEILYNDSRQVVINKPANTAIQGKPYDPASRAWHQLVADVEKRIGAKESLKIVHRLDATTSGALILAKTASAAKALTLQFRERAITKSYLGIVSHSVHAWVHGQHGVLDCLIQNDGTSISIANDTPNEPVSRVRYALSEWQRLSYTSEYSVLRLRPVTGRKHQLRVQCAQILQSPIVGDFKYGYRGGYADGVLLHCHNVTFYTWDKTGKRSNVKIRAALPCHMTNFAFRHQLDLTLPD